MNRLTQWIADNPVITTWITLISLIGVVIIVIALIMQIRDKKRKIICFIKILMYYWIIPFHALME